MEPTNLTVEEEYICIQFCMNINRCLSCLKKDIKDLNFTISKITTSGLPDLVDKFFIFIGRIVCFKRKKGGKNK